MKDRIRSRPFGSILSCVLVSAFLQSCGPFLYHTPRSRVFSSSVENPAASIASPKTPESKEAMVTERKVQEQELESVSPSPSAPDRPGDSIGELPVSGAASFPGRISLRESAIEETDLKEEPPPAPPAELGEGRMEALAKGTIPPPMAEEPSLLARITPATPPRIALSLRLTEEGRRLLENQEYEKALAKLEKAIALDSRNRFGYYYLARAHHHLGDQRQSLNFLEIVEPILIEEPIWLARVLALKGNNYVALGSFRRADESYAKALEADPYNQEALEGLSILSSKQ